jgi:hypothetical protein
MISGSTGNPIPCCWGECMKPGDDGYQAIVNEPQRKIHYLFCSEGHLMYWVNSKKSLGNLPSGSKSLVPVQGVTLKK